MKIRPRRNRNSSSSRALVEEATLSVDDLVWPVFVKDGDSEAEEISAMPGCFRYSLNELINKIKEAYELGIRGIALFPVIEESLKDPMAKESHNKGGLMARAIEQIKASIPEIIIFSDVAMDPYSSDGHDGIVKNGKILNDETLEVLGKMALVQAKAGADYVAPSDMMDGRVKYLRKVLDKNGFSHVGIMSYCAKYASAFYGPFRDALDSTPKFGDKKTYQMSPGNRREAMLELKLDLKEGADIVMVKPALSYLDIISDFKRRSLVPVAAYNVSGEYAMVKVAAEKGLLDEKSCQLEILQSIKRAGADIIFTYSAVDVARWLAR